MQGTGTRREEGHYWDLSVSSGTSALGMPILRDHKVSRVVPYSMDFPTNCHRSRGVRGLWDIVWDMFGTCFVAYFRAYFGTCLIMFLDYLGYNFEINLDNL